MDSVVGSQVRAQFEALLFEPMLEPLAAAFGEYGSIAVNEFSSVLARQTSL